MHRRYPPPPPGGSGVRRRPAPGDEAAPFPLVTPRAIEERLFDAFVMCAELSALTTPREGLGFGVQLVRRLVPSEAAFGSLYDIDEHVLRVVTADPVSQLTYAERTLSPDTGLVALALRHLEPPLRFEDGEGGARLVAAIGSQVVHARNAMYMPLRWDDGLVGLIHVVNRLGDGPFTDDDSSVLQYVGGQLAEFVHDAALALAMPVDP